MADLGNGGARVTPAMMRQQIARLQREVATLRSTNRILARGSFGANTIPGSALQQPAAPGLLSSTLMDLAIPAAGGVLLEQQFTVPPRMTAAVVVATARVFAMNRSGSAGALLVRAEVEDQQGNAVPVPAEADAGAVNIAPCPSLVVDLAGGQTLSARVWAQASNADWPADPANMAELSGLIAWFA